MVPSRPAYWEIEPIWLFYALAAVAVLVFGAGVARRVVGWRRGRAQLVLPPVGRGLEAVLRDGLLGARLFRGDVSAGLMHLALMWGFIGLFIGTVTVAVDHYLVGFLTGRVYIGFSIAMEVCGLLLLIGVLWALVRRVVQRVPRLSCTADDFVVPIWLLALGLSGFGLEGARLVAQEPAWASYSFVGHAMAGAWPEGERALTAYRALWWGHAVASLGLVAYLPWSKLMHALLAPATLFARDAIRTATSGDEEVVRFGRHQLLHGDACVRCGRCDDVCPSTGAGEPLSPRACVQASRRAVTTAATLVAQSWYCTTCGACAWACPLSITPIDTIAQARRGLIEDGAHVPPQLAETLERLHKYDNPWVAKKGQKGAWQDRSANPAQAELLYFVGCTTALDTRAQGIARALTAVLDRCGLAFTTLGKKEPCCGDIARRVGELGLFEEHRDKTEKLFDAHGVVELVTSSPHCWDTLAHAYPGERRAAHYTQLLARLLEDGRLTFAGKLDSRVTFHDPCYLGRHNGVVDEPRRVIRATGAELVEMEPHGEASLCCGGGGGRMWQELPEQGQLAQRRIRQAVATGAEILITACPLCLIMLEDARKTSGLEDRIEVRDLTELVGRALEV